MKTLIVNLPQAVERRKHILNELRENSIEDWEWVDGINVSCLSSTEVSKNFDFRKSLLFNWRRLSSQEIGCTLAHRNVWRKAKDLNAPCLVLEDDVKLNPGFAQWINNLVESLDVSEPWIYAVSPGAYISKKEVKKQNGVYSLIWGWGAYCYVISPRAAGILLSRRSYTTSDEWGEYIKYGLKVYTSEIFCVEHVSYFEDKIGFRGWNRNWSLLKKLRIATRNILFFNIWLPYIRRAVRLST